MERQGLGLVALVPRMLPDLVHVDPLRRISHEDPRDHVLSFRREEVRQGVVGIQDLPVQIGRLLVFVRQVATEHGVEDDSARPEIGHEAVVLVAGNHLKTHQNLNTYFRRGIARRATGGLQIRTLFIQVAQSEVHNLESFVVIDQQVLRLQVSVADSQLVDVLDA